MLGGKIAWRDAIEARSSTPVRDRDLEQAGSQVALIKCGQTAQEHNSARLLKVRTALWRLRYGDEARQPNATDGLSKRLQGKA